MRYWINSNSGDYITEHRDGSLVLSLISRLGADGCWIRPEEIKINNRQFSLLKGFIPIKKKKLFNQLYRFGSIYKENKYAPTISNGVKGESVRITLPTISESRDMILESIGL